MPMFEIFASMLVPAVDVKAGDNVLGASGLILAADPTVSLVCGPALPSVWACEARSCECWIANHFYLRDNKLFSLEGIEVLKRLKIAYEVPEFDSASATNRMSSVLTLNGQNPQVSVKYGEDFGSDTYKLLEVDERLLQELHGDGLTVKGHPEEEAVLCTSAATYAIKFVSTSNTVLLLPPTQSSRDCEAESTLCGNSTVTKATAVAAVTGHLEVVEILPRIENLKLLLGLQPYKEDEDVAEVVEGEQVLFTWEDLLTRVQASESELKKALVVVGAVKIGQYWRVVDSDLAHSVLEIILLTARQHDWPLHALLEADVVRAMEADNYPPFLVMHCLRRFGSRTDSHSPSRPDLETTSLDLDARWALDEPKVCLQFAKRLLNLKEKWRLDAFLESWRKSIPAEIETKLEMLSGEVLFEVVGPETWLHYFSVGTLPKKPEDRFATLFQRRAKWGWDDLEPYLRDLKEPNRSVEAMLLKFTRKTQPSAQLPPIYTAR